MPRSKSFASKWRSIPHKGRIALALALVILAVAADVRFRHGKALLPIVVAWLSQAVLDAFRDLTKETWQRQPHRKSRTKKPKG